jgi:hypothetical protein
MLREHEAAGHEANISLELVFASTRMPGFLIWFSLQYFPPKHEGALDAVHPRAQHLLLGFLQARSSFLAVMHCLQPVLCLPQELRLECTTFSAAELSPQPCRAFADTVLSGSPYQDVTSPELAK